MTFNLHRNPIFNIPFQTNFKEENKKIILNNNFKIYLKFTLSFFTFCLFIFVHILLLNFKRNKKQICTKPKAIFLNLK